LPSLVLVLGCPWQLELLDIGIGNCIQLPILYNALALTRGGEGGGGGGVYLVYNGQIFQRENMFGVLCMWWF
jgi:hypothetical protein